MGGWAHGSVGVRCTGRLRGGAGVSGRGALVFFCFHRVPVPPPIHTHQGIGPRLAASAASEKGCRERCQWGAPGGMGAGHGGGKGEWAAQTSKTNNYSGTAHPLGRRGRRPPRPPPHAAQWRPRPALPDGAPLLRRPRHAAEHPPPPPQLAPPLLRQLPCLAGGWGGGGARRGGEGGAGLRLAAPPPPRRAPPTCPPPWQRRSGHPPPPS